ncbi:ATP synthase d subunit [Coemansia sp. RSA 376]|nr:ATP synthase d subunit [Coemansia sp. S17]KAJ2019169.1 ATP synthase d subunit [Coemansia sp. S680]KAJ2042326.1 ATP synthase d subunit [Coemansia sp. S16]KAJ2052568.1 ATP synthase d subunit [Coemansia sp. S2]KAJ2096055.1 ATP synthase d subunit [Coemansia sp. S100]KAJ2100990.1 ATP synthase d subunit [Coemansia sp. RSA 922]KAJ2263184.1 ATP synthase d subunit [Coemansia sp. RSA 376]KAJ2423462.1 ATP synthase d subunit [Coemansia sp. RSA 2531]
MSVTGRKFLTSINWPVVSSVLSKHTEITGSLAAFRKGYEEAERQLTQLKEADRAIDFDHYRRILKNNDIVDKLEKVARAQKIVKVDLADQLKTISVFEAKAIASAELYVKETAANLADLNETVANIETARPVTQLTVEDVVKAKPDVVQYTEEMVKQGKFTVDGYDERFPSLSLL